MRARVLYILGSNMLITMDNKNPDAVSIAMKRLQLERNKISFSIESWGGVDGAVLDGYISLVTMALPKIWREDKEGVSLRYPFYVNSNYYINY